MLRFIFPMLILTGARKREVLDAKWSDFDLSRRAWRIPITKSGRARHVPLSDGALTLLATMPRKSDCEWAFANPETGKPYVSIFYAWNSARNSVGLSDVRIHLGEFEAGSLKVVEPASGTEALTDKNPKTVYNGTLDTPLLLSANGYGLASVGLQAGATGRPKTVQITANDNTQTVTLADQPEMPWFTLPVLVGYTGSSWGRIGVKVIDTYGGAGFTLAGVALNAATIEEF